MHMYFAHCVLKMLFQCSFDVCDVCSYCCQFPRVVNQVAAGHDLDAVLVFFLGSKIHNNVCVCRESAGGHVFDIFWCHNKHGVGADCACLIVALTHPSEIFPKGCLPSFTVTGLFISFYSLILFPRSQDGPLALCSVQGSWSGRVTVVIS